MGEENEANGTVPANAEDAGSEEGGAAEGAEAAPADPLAEAKAEAQKNKEQWMRTAADFDNFRKRSRREIDDARRGGREDMLKEFLPVFDNLERAIQSAQRAQDVKPVADGLNMILRQFIDTLGRVNITKVATVGKDFDPTVHEAIQQVETDEHPPGTVVAEVQPGYIQGERLVRPAMVVVAKPKASAKEDGGEGGASGTTEGA
jgi:molecular chaperone GrpE